MSVDIEPEVGQLLTKLIDHWRQWDQYEAYYLEKLAPRLVAAPTTGDATERPLLLDIKARLTPEQWKQLPILIRECRAQAKSFETYRREVEQRTKEEEARREAERCTLIATLRDMFRSDFLSARPFYEAQCSSFMSESEYEAEKLAYLRPWAERNLAPPPDAEQLQAIGTVEGHVQVIARAGSGKTTTLVNRALFLQRHCGVLPHEILLLAFNRKAAGEITERLRSKAGSSTPFSMTFHALAYALVHPEEAILFDEPDGAQRKSRALQAIIDDYLRTEQGYERVRALMMAHFRDDWERIALGGYHLGREDLLRYRRSLPKVGLDGTYLKSSGEKAVADFLFEHDIAYRYERNFWWGGINYRPDFTIATGDERGIVIEYFGMKGDPDYDESAERKRRYWRRKPGWTLIELSPADLATGGVAGLHQTLRRLLEEHGIRCVRLCEDAIWERIQDRAIDRFTRVVVGFVQRCRKLSLTPDELRERIGQHKAANLTEQRFLALAQTFYDSYLARVSATGEDDFDGLLQQAARQVEAGHTVFRRRSGSGDLRALRYIFIDEYQDFSELFSRLIAAIRAVNPQAQFCCVGDDWQAINGFAGSDLRFYESFPTMFAPSRRVPVTTNYRSASAIVHVGNALMDRRGDPGKAHSTKPGSVLIADLANFEPAAAEKARHRGDNFTPAIVRLVRKATGTGREVILLSRRNGLPWFISDNDERGGAAAGALDRFLKLVRSHLPHEERDLVSISTAHKFKGLEKHTVVVLDAVFRCYPLIHPDLLFTRILGDTLERIVDEERRLIYVALTRAVEQLIIVTEREDRSPFLDGLLGDPALGQVQWAAFPPPTDTSTMITITIGNQAGRSGNGTYAIRDRLKTEGYQWDGAHRHWWRTLPAEGFSMEQFMEQSVWSAEAEGLEVLFRSDGGEVLAAYRVTQGRWMA